MTIAVVVHSQALQDILDDDEDIGAMYLGRKAAAKEAAAERSRSGVNGNGPGSRSTTQDDELLVAEAMVHTHPTPRALSSP